MRQNIHGQRAVSADHDQIRFGARRLKKNNMLNSPEHEILNAHQYKNIEKFSIFHAQISLECFFSSSKMLKSQQLFAF